MSNVVENEETSKENNGSGYHEEHPEGPTTYWPDRATADRFGSIHRWEIGRVRWYHEDIRLYWMPSTRELFIVDDYDNGNAYVRCADDGAVIHWFMMKHAQTRDNGAFFEDLIRRDDDSEYLEYLAQQVRGTMDSLRASGSTPADQG
jgi:hypothetical protein